jgi:magnesium transporter
MSRAEWFTLISMHNGFPIDMQVMSVKALGMSLKLTFEGMNQLVYPETWFFMLVVVTCVVTQMNYLNKVSACFPLKLSIKILFECTKPTNVCFWQALDTFNTAIVSPIYYVLFTTLTILASVIMFKVIYTILYYPFKFLNFL